MTRSFENRSDAGRKLGERLHELRGPSTVVVGVAPGGVPVAYEVAVALEAPLEAWAVHHLGSGEHPLEHVGAIAENAGHALHPHGAHDQPSGDPELAQVAAREHHHLHRLTASLHHHPRASIRNQTVLLVDDGAASGAGARAAVQAIRQEKPHRIIAAIPVATRASLARIDPYVDGLVCLQQVDQVHEVIDAYGRFDAVPDAEAAALLDRRRHDLAARPSSIPSPPRR